MLKEKLLLAINSRTVWTIVLIVIVNIPYVKQNFLTADTVELVNLLLGMAGIYFRVDTKKTLSDYIKEGKEGLTKDI